MTGRLSITGAVHETTGQGAIVLKIESDDTTIPAAEAVVPVEQLDTIIAALQRARTLVATEIARKLGAIILPSGMT